MNPHFKDLDCNDKFLMKLESCDIFQSLMVEYVFDLLRKSHTHTEIKDIIRISSFRNAKSINWTLQHTSKSFKIT